MQHRYSLQTLKEAEQHILNAVSLRDTSLQDFKTLAAFDFLFKNHKALITCVVIDLRSKQVLDTQHLITDEVMPHSPRFSSFREGPAIIELLKSLSQKPSVVVVKGYGSLHSHTVGLASYLGVLVNLPCLGVSDTLPGVRISDDILYVGNLVKGYVVKTKAEANPVYVTAGHQISPETAKKIIEDLVHEQYKLPLPLHLAHKLLVKLKKEM